GQSLLGPLAARGSGPAVRGDRVRASAVLIALLLSGGAIARAGEAPAGESGPAEVVAALKTAWDERNIPAYLSQWSFSSPEAEKAEREFVSGRFETEAGKSRLALYAPPTVAPTVKRLTSYGEIVTI